MNKDLQDIENYNLEEEEVETGPAPRRPRHPMLMLLRMFVSPVKAWKELRNSMTPDVFASGCFYPLVALATASTFMRLVYNPELKLSEEIIHAVVVFVSFFLGYFCVFFLCRLILPEDARERIDTPFGRVYLMAGMSTLAIFFTLGQFLPDLDALLVFLPLFTIYISARGAKYLRLKRAGENITGWIAALLEIFVPYAIYELFPLIIPNS